MRALFAMTLFFAPLTQDQIINAMKSVSLRVHDCLGKAAEKPSSLVKVLIEVLPSGKVGSTRAEGYEGSPFGQCIEAEVRKAIFPPFEGEPFRFHYPFVFY
jgi:hypothetical protein